MATYRKNEDRIGEYFTEGRAFRSSLAIDDASPFLLHHVEVQCLTIWSILSQSLDFSLNSAPYKTFTVSDVLFSHLYNRDRER